MDDEIIHSWCFHDVKCFDSTPSAAIIVLDKDLESFSSLRSQHWGRRRSFPEREEISPEEKRGMAGDGDGGWRILREEGDLQEEEEPEKMAARRSGGGGGGGLRTATSR